MGCDSKRDSVLFFCKNKQIKKKTRDRFFPSFSFPFPFRRFAFVEKKIFFSSGPFFFSLDGIGIDARRPPFFRKQHDDFVVVGAFSFRALKKN